MRKIIVAFLIIITFYSEIKGQGSNNGQAVYAHGGLNLGVEIDPVNNLKINEYITNDAQEVNQYQFRYGSTLKLFQKKAGLIVGYAITKSGGVNKVAVAGTKFNLGVNFCTEKNQLESFQVGCYFNWGKRNYFFDNTLFIPTSSITPNSISSDVNLIQFNQRSIGAMLSSPALSFDNNSVCRIVFALEYNLNSSYWNVGKVRIPEYEGSGFVTNVMFQFDFGKSISRWHK